MRARKCRKLEDTKPTKLRNRKSRNFHRGKTANYTQTYKKLDCCHMNTNNIIEVQKEPHSDTFTCIVFTTIVLLLNKLYTNQYLGIVVNIIINII